MDADHGPARTPVIVPERTATFKTQQSLLMELDGSSDVVMLGNHTAAASHAMYTFKGDVASALLRNEAETIDAHIGEQNERLQVKLIQLGSRAAFLQDVTAFSTSYDVT